MTPQLPSSSPEVALGKREPAPEVVTHQHNIRSPPGVNHERLSPRHSLGARLEAKYGSPYRSLKYSRSCVDLGSLAGMGSLAFEAELEDSAKSTVSVSGRGGGKGERSAFTCHPLSSGSSSSHESLSPTGDVNAEQHSIVAPDPLGGVQSDYLAGTAGPGDSTGKSGSVADVSGLISTTTGGHDTTGKTITLSGHDTPDEKLRVTASESCQDTADESTASHSHDTVGQCFTEQHGTGKWKEKEEKRDEDWFGMAEVEDEDWFGMAEVEDGQDTTDESTRVVAASGKETLSLHLALL